MKWLTITTRRFLTQGMSCISCDEKGYILLRVHAKPGAKKSQITDLSSDRIGIQIAAPAREGEANIELLSYLQSVLKIKISEIYLERGGKSRIKTVKVTSTKHPIEDIQTLLAESVRP